MAGVRITATPTAMTRATRRLTPKRREKAALTPAITRPSRGRERPCWANQARAPASEASFVWSAAVVGAVSVDMEVRLLGGSRCVRTIAPAGPAFDVGTR